MANRASADRAKARLKADKINQRILETVLPAEEEAARIGGVAITGSAGSMGVPLVIGLARRPGTEKIIAIDTQYPIPFAPNMIFHRRDPLRELDDIFQLHQPEVAIHLATAQAAMQDEEQQSFDGVLSYHSFFAACDASRPRCVVLLSGPSVYGAWPDNPESLSEDAPLRPRPENAAAAGYAEAEKRAAEYATVHPDVRVLIVRSAPILGSNAHHALARALRQPSILTLPDCHPLLQFVHEDDFVRALVALVNLGRRGVYNVGADEPISLAQCLTLAGVRAQPLSQNVLTPTVNLAQRLHLQTFGALDLEQIVELCYPLVLNNGKLKSELGFHYAYTSEQAVQAFVGRRATPNGWANWEDEGRKTKDERRRVEGDILGGL